MWVWEEGGGWEEEGREVREVMEDDTFTINVVIRTLPLSPLVLLILRISSYPSHSSCPTALSIPRTRSPHLTSIFYVNPTHSTRLSSRIITLTQTSHVTAAHTTDTTSPSSKPAAGHGTSSTTRRSTRSRRRTYRGTLETRTRARRMCFITRRRIWITGRWG